MTDERPFNKAMAFESRIRDESERYAAAGYKVDDATIQKQLGTGSSVQTLSPVTLQDQPVPPRRWIVEGLIPAGNVTMLAGDGGLGKSLLALQLLTCTAIGKPWLGFGTLACPSLGVFCEDDLEELHRRQADINAHYDCSFSDLTGCTWMPRVGEGNVLMTFPKDRPGQPTRFYGDVLEHARATKARLVVLDSLHDLFGGDENRRSEARQFIGSLRAMILPLDGAVLLLCHPSLSGMNSGTGSAGSTAWNNALRGRLYLTRPTPRKTFGEAPTEDDGDTNERVLKTMKANYSALGGKVRLRWEGGVFVRQDEHRATSLIDKIEIDRLVLDGMRQMVANDTKLPLDPNAATGFANVLRKRRPDCKHLGWKAVCDAQDRLLAAGKATRVEMGPPSKRRVYIRPSDMLYPGEGKQAE